MLRMRQTLSAKKSSWEKAKGDFPGEKVKVKGEGEKVVLGNKNAQKSQRTREYAPNDKYIDA